MFKNKYSKLTYTELLKSKQILKIQVYTVHISLHLNIIVSHHIIYILKLNQNKIHLSFFVFIN